MSTLACIFIIWKRDIKRYLRERSQIFSTLFTSLLWLVLFGIGIGAMELKRVDINYQAFLFPGIISMALLVTSVRSGISVIRDREFGFLRVLMITPAPRHALVLGKVLGGSTAALLQALVLLSLGWVLEVRVTPLSFAQAALLVVLTSLGFVALGVVIANLIDSLEGFNLVMSLLIMPAFFTSGALFPIFVLPEWMQTLAKLNPLSYGVDALREVLVGFPPSYFGLGRDVATLAAFTSAMLLLAVFTFERRS
jgi:ABC-2 type transport system permease protein